jgi:hypothetical protein
MVFGAMHEDEARQSLELFSRDVIPALAGDSLDRDRP